MPKQNRREEDVPALQVPKLRDEIKTERQKAEDAEYRDAQEQPAEGPRECAYAYHRGRESRVRVLLNGDGRITTSDLLPGFVDCSAMTLSQRPG